MKKNIVFLALLLACNKEQPLQQPTPAQAPPQSQAAQPAPGAEATVPRITPAELLPKMASVTIIDVRHADNYMFAHIPGSLHIPLSFIEQEAPFLPKDKPIVTYCT
jgi:hypothetical protein